MSRSRDVPDSPPLVSEEHLANSYSTTSSETPFEIYQQYQEFRAGDEYWTNFARQNDLPKSRIQRWDRGGQPATVETLEVAMSNGWTADEWTPTVEAIGDLVVALIASGSVDGAVSPQWSIGDSRPGDIVIDALDTVGVGSEQSGTIITPEQHEVALGRALVVAGAPRSGPEGLPEWVFEAPAELRRRWLWILVVAQGSQMKDRSLTRDIQRSGSQTYFEDLARLIEDVTGEAAIVKDDRMTVPAAAVEAVESME